MNNLVSIIIPVYNSENSILRCLDSIQNQKFQDFEIIIVDDGSVDNSLELCKLKASEDSRIKIFHLENNGVSHARNYGISKSNGKWIMFIDSDDFLLKNALSHVEETIKKVQADIYCWNSIYSKNNNLVKMNNICPKKYLYGNDEIYKLMIGLYCRSENGYYGDYFRAVWSKIFSSDFIKKNEIEFPTDIKIGEDAIFLLNCFAKSSKVFIENEFLYGYECTDTSVTGRYKEDFQVYQIDEFEIMKRYFEKYDLNINAASTEFWHKGEKDFILNELKSNKTVFEISKKTSQWVNEHSIIKKYLCMKDKGEGFRGKLRSFMFRCDLVKITVLIDTIILKRKSMRTNEFK